MADLKRWFKVWTTINNDPHFQQLPLEAIGRWVLLGAYVAENGSHGTLLAPSDSTRLLQVLRVGSMEEAKKAVSGLPNVRFTPPQSVQFEEGQNHHGELTVTFNKWRKYQEDSTQAERQKASRAKRRGEEKRGEPPNPPVMKAVTRHPNHGQHCQCERCEAARRAEGKA